LTSQTAEISVFGQENQLQHPASRRAPGAPDRTFPAGKAGHP